MGTAKVKPKEYLSNDILEEEFIRTFTWLHRIQKIVGSCRVDAQNRFVTAPTSLQKCYTILCILYTIFLYYIFVILRDKFVEFFNDSVLIGLNFAFVGSHFIAYVCHLIHVRFRNNQDNAVFYVKMQKNDRHMGIERTEEIYNTLRWIYMWSLSILIITYVVQTLGIVVTQEWRYFVFVGFATCHFTFIVELIHCSGLIVHFVIRLRLINGILKNYLSGGKTVAKTKMLLTRKSIRSWVAENHKFETSETGHYLRELLECFAIFQKLYRFELFLFSVKLVVISLIAFEILLFGIQRNRVVPIGFAALIIFTLMDVFIALVIGYRLEMLFDEVADIKRNAIAIMAIHHEGPLRRKAKDMLRTIEETPPVLSIYDMWEMHSRIFLTILTLVTSLIVTLLQFLFL